MSLRIPLLQCIHRKVLGVKLYKELCTLNQSRARSTISVIENNSRFYLGLRKELYTLVQFISDKRPISYTNVLTTLKKIRLGDVYTRLATDFGLSTSSIQRIFCNGVPLIADMLQNFIFWPPTKTVKRMLPIPFRLQYSKVICIIDCFEIQIQKPTNAVTQSQTWSEYKKCNTLKYLISGTPHGFINFISSGYGGRITDRNIVSVST